MSRNEILFDHTWIVEGMPDRGIGARKAEASLQLTVQPKASWLLATLRLRCAEKVVDEWTVPELQLCPIGTAPPVRNKAGTILPHQAHYQLTIKFDQVEFVLRKNSKYWRLSVNMFLQGNAPSISARLEGQWSEQYCG